VSDQAHHILVADDERVFREFLARLIQARGYVPVQAESGQEALAVIQSAPLSAALIDLQLGDMSGLDVLREIKQRAPNTECIMLTAHASQASAIEAVNVGAFGYIEKPFDKEVLLNMLRHALEKRAAAMALRENESLLRQAMHIAQLGFWEWDIATDVTQWHGDMFRIYGITPEEFTGRGSDYLEFTRADYRPTQRESIRLAFEKGITEDQLRDEMPIRHDPKELCIVRPDGTEVYTLGDAVAIVDETGRPLRMIGVTLDITERKRIQAVLQARLRLVEFAATHSLDELLTATLDEVEVLTGSTIGFYHFVEPDQRTLSLQSWSTNTLAHLCTAEGKGRHYPIDKAGVWTDAMHERRPIIHNDYASLPHRKGLPEGHAPINREVVTPIFRGDQIKAIIGIGNKPTPYNEDDLKILAQLGDLSWDMVERKQAEEQLRRSEAAARAHDALTEALRDTLVAINSTLDLNEVLDRIMANLEKVVPYDAASMMRIEDGIVRFTNCRGYAERGLEDWLLSLCVPASERPLLAEELHSRGVMIVPDTRADPLWVSTPQDDWVHSWMSVPVTYGDRVFGFLNLNSATPGFFKPEYSEALRLFADQAAAAIRNAELYQSERQQRILAETFRRVAEALSGSARLDETLTLVIEQLAQIIDYDQALVWLVEGDFLRVVAAKGEFDSDQTHDILNSNFFHTNNSLFHKSMTSGEPVIIEDMQDHSLGSQIPLVQQAMRSWIGMPLRAWGMTIGFLSIGSQQPYAYRASDVETIKALAQQVALAIENSRIYAQLETSTTNLQRAEANLAQAARLAVAGEIATGIAHQINNPLTTIVAHTHMLLKRQTPDDPMYQPLETIRQAAYRAGSVVQHLLSFARPNTYELQPVDVNQTILAAVALVRPQIEPHVARLSVDLAADTLMVNGSAQHLEDTWINLILNARDAVRSHDESFIKITSRLIDNGAQIEVRVQDNGTGIAPDVLPRIFLPMFTTKTHGTGLGLPVCRDVIQYHQGHIDVSSQVGEGTTFVVVLPRLS
jgi:PAS domain S-box-containing protein